MRRRRKRGFTMLEALVSTIILAAAVTTVVQLGSQTIRLQREMDRRVLAEIEASNLMDRAMSLSYSQLTAPSLAEFKLSPVAEARLPGAAIAALVDTEKDDESGLSAKRVEITVFWNDESGQHIAEPARLVGWKHSVAEPQP